MKALFLILACAGSVWAEESLFRPTPGEFPPLEKARFLCGELVFVDHVNRRGSLRLHVEDHYQEGKLHHFAMLPYGIIRYQGAPAALRDIPLGTVLSGRFYLPPDPDTSVVPVVNPKSREVTRPPQNHAILLEDEVSRCLREKRSWQLEEVEVSGKKGHIVAHLDGRGNDGVLHGKHTLTFDESTRIWRGREFLGVADLIADGTWPRDGKKVLADLPVHVGLTWHPRYLYDEFHLSDLFLDDEAVAGRAARQRGRHLRHRKLRWMPARVDAVKYGRSGQATVTATLYGGMAEALYTDFQEGRGAQMAAAEQTLRTWWPDHDGMDGTLVAVTPKAGPVTFGSSGIQITFETELVLEGFRPGRTVKIRPQQWPKVKPPYEELIKSPEDRWPGWEIFE